MKDVNKGTNSKNTTVLIIQTTEWNCSNVELTKYLLIKTFSTANKKANTLELLHKKVYFRSPTAIWNNENELYECVTTSRVYVIESSEYTTRMLLFVVNYKTCFPLRTIKQSDGYLSFVLRQ